MSQEVDEHMSLSRRIVRANWGLLAAAFSEDSAGVRWYLQADTGEIVRVVAADCAPDTLLDEGFIGIERARSKEQYRWMQRYIAVLADRDLASRLHHALAGKRAFHRFKAVLSKHPGSADAWYEFRSGQLSRYIHAWLEAHEIVVPFDGVPSFDGDALDRSQAAQKRRLDAVIEELTARDLDSLLALAELLYLDMRVRRREAG
jgi:hypothetical protein